MLNEPTQGKILNMENMDSYIDRHGKGLEKKIQTCKIDIFLLLDVTLDFHVL